MITSFERRTFLRGLAAGALSSCAPLLADSAKHDTAQLDQFIASYMQAMNAPGLTLALADKNGVVRTAGFGYSDLELRTPVTPEHWFEIGSITKSFVGLTLLQLREEGKLDLHKPILNYLPWLPIEASFGPITAHHLLTHSSGLPGALGLFLSDPQARHVQGFKPGEHFYYCNVGFNILGHLIETLDGRSWPAAVQNRILEPLGMTSTQALIDDTTKAKRSRSYVPFYTDRNYLANGRLATSSDIVFDRAAGSITSTPADMARYLQMLLNRGQYAHGRIVSEEGFAAFSKPYIKADEFGSTASYGYGIAVDTLDGHTILRHTGGMVSFASSIHVDLDGGVAAFASINAMQGYRPVPVTQYAVQLMNSKTKGEQSPKTPPLPDSNIANAKDYVGIYKSSNGKHLEVMAEGERLLIHSNGVVTQLDPSGSDLFGADTLEWNRFPLIFGRSEVAADSGQKGPVVELEYGSDWYTNASYSGVRSFADASHFQPFAGFYHADSAWGGSVRVVIRKGKLWVDGIIPLEPIGNALFRVGDEAWGPDTIQFHHVVDGKAQLMKWNGADSWRVAMD